MKAIVCMNGICRYPFREKAKLNFAIVSAAAFTVISAILLLRPDFELIDSVFVLLSLMTVLVVFREGRLKITVTFFISYLCISIVDIFIDLLLSKLQYSLPDINLSNDFSFVLINSVSLLLLCFITVIIKNNESVKQFPMAKLHWSFYILIIWTLFCFGFMISYFQILKLESNDKISYFLIVSMFVVSLGMGIIFIMLSRVSYSRDKYKALSKMNQEYLDMQQQYYVLLSEKNKDTRRFRHDIKNHLLCMQSLFQDDKIDEMRYYLSDLVGGFHETIPKINTGNNIVDAIINDILTKNPEIQIAVIGSFDQSIHMNAMDLCTIFSNALTNAVEAVRKLNDIRPITFDIKNLENNIFIRIANPVAKKVLIDGCKVSTSKAEKNTHGFGLENIKKTVDKYKGSLELSCTENEFALEFVFKNKI
jgi:hypothetical protein